MTNKAVKHHEPLVHIVKRDQGAITWKSRILIRAIAIALALLVSGIMVSVLADTDPMKVYKSMISGVFGTERRRWNAAQGVAMLLCVSLAVTPAFKMKFWNIGAEGQVLVGGLAATACMVYFGEKVPLVVLYLIMTVASILAGAIWGLIPAIFKAKWNTNETLFTLMMNYVASGLVAYFLLLWTPSGSSVLGRLDAGHLPVIGHEFLLLILLVMLLTGGIFVYQKYTKQGYELSVVGESENTAKYIGINVKTVIIRTMLISGAICGFAGFLIVGALDHSVAVTSVGGMGFTAIMVSWLAKFNPLIMIGTSAFITFLDRGAAQITTTFNIDSSFPDMVIGIVLFFVIGCEFFVSYQLKRKVQANTSADPVTEKKSEKGGNEQ